MPPWSKGSIGSAEMKQARAAVVDWRGEMPASVNYRETEENPSVDLLVGISAADLLCGRNTGRRASASRSIRRLRLDPRLVSPALKKHPRLQRQESVRQAQQIERRLDQLLGMLRNTDTSPTTVFQCMTERELTR
jgi:hypothetical protein